ncbi:MAG: class I SAM-dependent rRNA methyltransferase [Verrucomicrobia bacterium]|nr:class I SAM-dependent rRNA methyltransferase [Verrucomicrobiota bacterium]
MQDGVKLKKGKEAIFYQRHLWIFSGAIESFPASFKDGEIAPVYSFQKELLGHAYFHRKISLSGRILSYGATDPEEALFLHLERAIALRERSFNPEVTNGYRLINGEGDFLPGLIIDQYNDTLVLQSNTLGMDLLKGKIVDFLIKRLSPKTIYEKSVGPSRREEGLKEEVGLLWGEDLEEGTILENGLTFRVSWKEGQKTGFFLDQRELRKKVGELSYGKRVLNTFCYTGGFTAYSYKGGAKEVDSLDISEKALLLAEKNLKDNGYEGGRFLKADAFAFLREDPLQYDLVILDPPAFAKKKADLPQAIKGYREIHLQALSKMPKDSILVTSSCSYYLDETLFQSLIFQAGREAKREIQILSRQPLGFDHPISLFHPESNYLKGFILRVL